MDCRVRHLVVEHLKSKQNDCMAFAMSLASMSMDPVAVAQQGPLHACHFPVLKILTEIKIVMFSLPDNEFQQWKDLDNDKVGKISA